MKIGICHTKIGIDADTVYHAWEQGVKLHGDEAVHCYSYNDLLRYNPDVIVCISYPQYNNLFARLIPEFPEMKDKCVFRASPINIYRTEIIKFANQNNKRLIFVDTGVLKCNRNRDGDKNNYFQVGFDCIKGLGEYYNNDVPKDRYEKLNIKLLPWRETNPNILIFGQLRFGIGSQHIDIHAWYRFCIRFLREHRYNAFYLEHPNVHEPFTHHNLKFKVIRNRELKYQDIGVTISFSSNAIVDAIINGIPSIAMSIISPAYNVCSHLLEDINNPQLFDREQWLSKLAYTQWQVTEMETGECWNHLRPHAMKSPSAQYPLIQKNILP